MIFRVYSYFSLVLYLLISSFDSFNAILKIISRFIIYFSFHSWYCCLSLSSFNFLISSFASLSSFSFIVSLWTNKRLDESLVDFVELWSFKPIEILSSAFINIGLFESYIQYIRIWDDILTLLSSHLSSWKSLDPYVTIDPSMLLIIWRDFLPGVNTTLSTFSLYSFNFTIDSISFKGYSYLV